MKELYDTILTKAKTAIEGDILADETRCLVDMAVKIHGCLFATTLPASNAPTEEQNKSVPKNSRPKIKKGMTETDLLSIDKVTPEIAAAYLQNGTNAHYLRLDAQRGDCPFMQAIRNKGRYSYRVNVGLLIKYKNGELGL